MAERALEREYRATRYEVQVPGPQGPAPIVLRVDEPSAALAALQAQLGVRASGVITAFNPGSEKRADDDNAAAQAQLAALLAAAGWPTLPAMNRSPEGDWDEPALFVAGIDAQALLVLGHACGQAAVLHAGEDATPRLLWTD